MGQHTILLSFSFSFLFLFFFFFIHGVIAPVVHSAPNAYVGISYHSNFLLPSWTLFKSIQLTGTRHDRVLLVPEPLSKAWQQRFHDIGVQVRQVSPIANPYLGGASRFDQVMMKLHVWELTEYDRVVYLDSDMIVTQNVDHLFYCGKFCSVMRHSDKFNTGIMVVAPSEARFRDLMRKKEVLGSYEGADQGFLNAYYSNITEAPFFGPDSKDRRQDVMDRLASVYNVDVGLYYMSGVWPIPEPQQRVLHFTLGSYKPWHWYYQPVLTVNPLWNRVARHVTPVDPDILAGTAVVHLSGSSFLVALLHYLFPRPSYLDAAMIAHVVRPLSVKVCAFIVCITAVVTSNIAIRVIPMNIVNVPLCWLMYILMQLGSTVSLTLYLCRAWYYGQPGSVQGRRKPMKRMPSRAVVVHAVLWPMLSVLCLLCYLLLVPFGKTIFIRGSAAIVIGSTALILTFIHSYRLMELHMAKYNPK
eukprot:gb/GECH01011994.1/.p1 GENE.gb/GECH01011994.1/~~gb/GECH01011994.1/.p1  ORF type:complete len:471 (+),score=48.64 gb/GECH01011994.1/:1-1413(+)